MEDRPPRSRPPTFGPPSLLHGVQSTPVAFFFVLFGLSLLAIGWLFSSFVTDAILAALFTGLARPLYLRLRALLGGREFLASAICCAAIVVLVALPATFLISTLSQDVADAYDSTREAVSVESIQAHLFGKGLLPRNARRLAALLGVEYTPASVGARLREVGAAGAALLYKKLNQFLSNLLAFLYHFAIMLLLVFYFLIDGAQLKRFLFRMSPLPTDEEELIAVKFRDVGRAILVGNGISSLAQGLLGGLAMTLVGFPSPVLYATLMSMTAFLPVIGVGVVIAPATLYLYLTGAKLSAAVFGAFCTLQSLLIENLLKPYLIGSHMKMHSLLVFLSLFGGIAVFGFLGVLYGPLIVTLFLTLVELYEIRYKRRILSPEEAES